MSREKVEKTNKKINNMSLEELQLKKEQLEKKSSHKRVTKSIKNPQTIKWESDETHSKYYSELIIEMNKRIVNSVV